MRTGVCTLLLILVLCISGVVQSFNVHDYLSDLRSKDPTVRKKTLVEVCTREPEEEPMDPKTFDTYVTILVKLSYDPDPEIRERTIRCLFRTHDARMIKPIARLLRDENAEVRATAAGVFFLIVLDDAEIIRELERLLKDRNKEVRMEAAMSLGTNGTRESLILLQKAYDEETDQEVKKTIGRAMRRLRRFKETSTTD